MVDLFFGKLLNVPRPQQGPVLRLFLYSFFLAASYQMGRTAADSIFLARLGVSTLPHVFLLSGIVVAVMAVAGSLLRRHFSFRVVASLFGVLLSLLTFVTTFELGDYHHGQFLLMSIYLLADLRGAIGAICIGWATHELIPKENRFSFAAVGLSVPIAGIFFGTLMGLESYTLPTSSWLVIAGAVDLFAVIPMWLGRRIGDGAAESSHRKGNAPSRKQVDEKIHEVVENGQPLNSSAKDIYNKNAGPDAEQEVRAGGIGGRVGLARSLAFAIVMLSFFKFVTLAIVSFEWKKYTEVYFGDNEQELTAYFSVFYAVTHLLTIVLQAMFASRLLHRKMFRWVLALMPILLFLLASLLIGFHGPMVALALLTAAKGMDSWRRSVDDTGMIVLVSRVPKIQRANVISITSGIIKPLSEIYAATVVWFLTFWASDFSVWVWAGGAFLWLAWAFAASGRSK